MRSIPPTLRLLYVMFSVSANKLTLKCAGVLPLNPIPTMNTIKSMSLSYEFYSTHNPARFILDPKRKIYNSLFEWVIIGIINLFLYRKTVRRKSLYFPGYLYSNFSSGSRFITTDNSCSTVSQIASANMPFR